MEDVYCLECKQIMCEECFNQHLQMKIFSKHQKGPKPEESIERCLNHTYKDLDYKCIDCNIQICEICSSTKHKNHKLEYIKDYYNKEKEDFNQNMIIPFENLEELLKDIKEKEDAVIKSINRESTCIIHSIVEMVDILTTTTEKVLNISNELIENVKINFNIMRMKYRELNYQLQNLNMKDSFNLFLLYKLPKENEIYKIELKEKLNEDFNQIKQMIKKFNENNIEIIFSRVVGEKEDIKELDA